MKRNTAIFANICHGENACNVITIGKKFSSVFETSTLKSIKTNLQILILKKTALCQVLNRIQDYQGIYYHMLSHPI